MLFISPFFCVSYPLLLLLGLPPGSPSSAQVPTPVLLPCPHPPSSTPFPDPSSVVELFHRPSRHSATSCRCSLYTHGLEQVCCGSGFGALSHTPRPPLVTPPPLVNFLSPPLFLSPCSPPFPRPVPSPPLRPPIPSPNPYSSPLDRRHGPGSMKCSSSSPPNNSFSLSPPLTLVPPHPFPLVCPPALYPPQP